MSKPIFETSHEMILMARRNLDQDNWDYICGAAESETSLRRNRMALDCLAFRPRICRDVSEIDSSTDFFGHPLRTPIFLAPMGDPQASSYMVMRVEAAYENLLLALNYQLYYAHY